MSYPQWIERRFKLIENNTTPKTEIIAGITTFMTMSYILIVNPSILSATGMDKGALITATALSSLIATLLMAFIANLPFALAPGMGLNAFFAFTVVIGMGYSWQLALTAVFIEGLIFLLLTLVNVREMIINSIPANIKHAVSVGIGLLIAVLGLSMSGIIQTGKTIGANGELEGNILQLGDITSGSALVALIGLLITGFLLAKNVKGAILIGILLTTIVGIPFHVTKISPDLQWISAPPSLAPIFCQFEWKQLFSWDMFIVLFTLLYMDMFDTVGTLIGVATKTNMLDENGTFPKAKQALLADALGTSIGAILGTSTVTTYVESTTGIASGGKTGLTSISTAFMFLLALFFTPILLFVPSAATAPALIIVGLFMMSPITKIDLEDFTEALPAFLTILIMPLTFSIADGIVFGVLSYVILKILTGKAREISIMIYILSILFMINIIVA